MSAARAGSAPPVYQNSGAVIRNKVKPPRFPPNKRRKVPEEAPAPRLPAAVPDYDLEMEDIAAAEKVLADNITSILQANSLFPGTPLGSMTDGANALANALHSNPVLNFGCLDKTPVGSRPSASPNSLSIAKALYLMATRQIQTEKILQNLSRTNPEVLHAIGVSTSSYMQMTPSSNSQPIPQASSGCASLLKPQIVNEYDISQSSATSAATDNSENIGNISCEKLAVPMPQPSPSLVLDKSEFAMPLSAISMPKLYQ